MQEYTITNTQRRDEWQSQYGSTMVDYAIALEGENGWIKLTQKLETPPPSVGQRITGVIEDHVTKNGTPFKKFKKVSPNFQRQPSVGGPAPSVGSSVQMDYIVQMLEELTGRRQAYEGEMLPSQPKDTEDPFEGLI